MRRSAVTRLLVALALTANDGPVSVERLRDLVARDPDRPESAESVHSLVSKLRASLPEGMLPPTGAGAGGYRLSAEVDVDWPSKSSSPSGRCPWCAECLWPTAAGRALRTLPQNPGSR